MVKTKNRLRCHDTSGQWTQARLQSIILFWISSTEPSFTISTLTNPPCTVISHFWIWIIINIFISIFIISPASELEQYPILSYLHHMLCHIHPMNRNSNLIISGRAMSDVKCPYASFMWCSYRWVRVRVRVSVGVGWNWMLLPNKTFCWRRSSQHTCQ